MELVNVPPSPPRASGPVSCAVRRGDHEQCRDDTYVVGAYAWRLAHRRVLCVVFMRVAVQPSPVAAASGASGPVRTCSAQAQSVSGSRYVCVCRSCVRVRP